MEIIWQALADMATSGAGLLLVGGAYFLWWLSGFVPNLFSPKQWSWKRGLQDFCKAALMATILIAATGLADIGGAFYAAKGWDIQEGIEAVSTFTLVGAMSLGFVYYISKALNNAINFFKLKWNEGKGNKEAFEQSQGELQEDIKDFFETITGKTSKEDIESAANTSDDPILDYKQIPSELAGMGGFANTYPEPYRSAAQDSILDPSKCFNRECVSYCAWKIKELTGNWLKRTGGMNAKYWVQRLAENGYGKVVDRPQNGGKYIGVSTVGQYGHVVWFEEENVISEYNYATRGAFSVRAINLDAYIWVEIKAPDTKTEAATEIPAKKPSTKKTIEYVYQAGDTFGAVITKLGLKTVHGLWDPIDGDVAYYTKQLGISGNIPVGTKLVFTKRA